MEFIFILILVMINAFFAATEIALVSVRPIKLKSLAAEGDKRAKIVLKLTEDPSRFLATIQVGITLSGFLASAAAAVSLSDLLARLVARVPIPLIAQASHAIAVFLLTVLISYITLVLGELVPKRLALQQPDRIALTVAGMIRIISKVVSPFVYVLTLSANLVLKLAGIKITEYRPKITEEEIKLMVSEQGTLMEEEKEMIHGIFEFGDTIAKEIMIPRIDMKCVDGDLTIGEVLEYFPDTGYSRLPVFKDTIDNIIGIVTIKDIVPLVVQGRYDRPITEVLRPAYFVPESKNVVGILRELQMKKISMAIVLDEYGGTAGLLTVEDLVEEIVGEIRDEYDLEEDGIRPIDENQLIVDGRVNVEELNQRLTKKLPEEEHYETLGGLILSELGKIPKVGDEIDLENRVVLRVEKMKGNRIAQVRVRTIEEDRNS